MGIFDGISNAINNGNIISESIDSKNNKDIRNVKFEVLIKEINDLFENKEINFDNQEVSWNIGSFLTMYGIRYQALDLVYDYEKLNNYGKIIYDNAKIKVIRNDDYSDYENSNDLRNKINKAKNLVSSCQTEEKKSEGYKFIFWSLLILTVDKTDYEEHLSLICDFARMLKITDDEIRDILHVIKSIYHKQDSSYILKTETIAKYFSDVLNLYN